MSAEATERTHLYSVIEDDYDGEPIIECVEVESIGKKVIKLVTRESCFGYHKRITVDDKRICWTKEDAVEKYLNNCRATVDKTESDLKKAIRRLEAAAMFSADFERGRNGDA
jgi:hypothetical protein